MMMMYLPRLIIDYLKYKTGWVDYNTTVKIMCTRLAGYNILYVKFFQWFAGDVNDELYDFFQGFKNNVPYTEDDIDWPAIQATGITNISERPINSGTIALIFKGKLYDRVVILKVLRKGIEPKIQSLFRHLRLVEKVLSYCYGSVEFPPANYFIDQTDFHKEAENINIFARKFEKNKNVRIPRVYLSTGKVIVMDYLESAKDQKQWTLAEQKTYNKIFTRFLVASYFIKDIYHADLHMGNLIFMREGTDYKIGLIDFGVIGFLNIENQNFIYDLFAVLSKNDYRLLSNRFARYATFLPKLEHDITEAFCTAFEKEECTNMEKFGHTHLRIIFQVLRQFNLRMDDNMNTYLFSVLSIISTMRAMTTPDEENTLKDIFRKFQ